MGIKIKEKYEGLGMTDWQIISNEIKSTNAKLDRLAKAYGTDSVIYQNALSKLYQIFPEGKYANRYTTTGKGVTHISQNIKYDLDPKEIIKKANLLSTKISTITEVKEDVRKALKEIYNVDVEDINRFPKEQQNKFIKNIMRLKDNWSKIFKEFYEIKAVYAQEKSAILDQILSNSAFFRDHPEIKLQAKMMIMGTKESKGDNIVEKDKKTYNDMNNLIMITEAMENLFDDMLDDKEIYINWLKSKNTKFVRGKKKRW